MGRKGMEAARSAQGALGRGPVLRLVAIPVVAAELPYELVPSAGQITASGQKAANANQKWLAWV